MVKLAVVTGGTKGIGRAVIEKFAGAGFDIVTCSRSKEDLIEVEKALLAQFPERKVFHQSADLAKKSDREGFVRFLQNLSGEIEVLVNNAGLFFPGQIHNEKEGALETMIETNLYSAYAITRGVIGGMINSRRGHIFNICSTASIMPYVNGGAYCVSKFALLGMTKVLREEMKQYNVRVTAVLPGATKTASWEGTDLPDERFMKPADVAEAIIGAYRLSPHSVVEEILIRPQLGDI